MTITLKTSSPLGGESLSAAEAEIFPLFRSTAWTNNKESDKTKLHVRLMQSLNSFFFNRMEKLLKYNKK